LPILEFLPEPADRAFSVTAYMLFPADDEARSEFIRAVFAAGFMDALEKPPLLHVNDIPRNLTIALGAAPRLDKAFKDRVHAARQRGRIVGTMFYFILQCLSRPETSKFASIACASRLISKVYPVECQTAKRFYWREFKSVAHLWAARLVWQRTGRLAAEDELCGLSDAAIGEFLGLAEALRQLGEGHGHKNGPPILRAGETWLSGIPATLDLDFLLPPHPSLIEVARPV
jgi:hypothetical protein